MEKTVGNEVGKTFVSCGKQLDHFVALLDYSTNKVTSSIMHILRYYNTQTRDKLDKPLNKLVKILDNTCKYLGNTSRYIKQRQEELQ